MPIHSPTDWDVTPQEAVQMQRELAARVLERNQPRKVRWVAGVDVGFVGEGHTTARAAIVVLEFPALKPVDCSVAWRPVTFPYIPGLLAFREIPVILQALEKLRIQPDVLIVDGHGRSHPRRIGIASHLGVLLDRTSIGCAKSLLCGRAPEPEDRLGAWEPLVEGEERIGAVLRTRVGVSPVYVSVGHRISLRHAVDLVLKCGRGYRLPETTRYAHRVAGGGSIELSGSQVGPL